MFKLNNSSSNFAFITVDNNDILVRKPCFKTAIRTLVKFKHVLFKDSKRYTVTGNYRPSKKNTFIHILFRLFSMRDLMKHRKNR